MVSIFARVGGVEDTVVEGKTLCNVFLTFKISVIQVLLQLQKGSRNFIKIFDISLADSNETFPFKFYNRDHQRRSDKRNQNVDTWNPQYGFKLTKSRRKMLLLSSHRYQLNNSYQKLPSIYGNVNNTLPCLTLKTRPYIL